MKKYLAIVRYSPLVLFMVLTLLVIAQPTPVAAQGATLEEVIVTAQRRDQNLQDVPIAVNVLSQSTLEDTGVGDISEVFNLLAGIDLETFGTTNQSNIFIRGVGTSLVDGGVEHSVSFYVDDVYQGAQQAFNTSLYDLESVEVLRGPQGTLYGKNSLGGAIKLTTVKPSNERSLKGEFSYGNKDYHEFRAVANMPIIEDKLMTRITGVYKQRDGIINNTAGTDLGSLDGWGLRGQFRIIPSDNVTMDLAVDFAHDEPTIGEGVFPDTVDSREATFIDQIVEDRDIWGISSNIEVDLSSVKITSISAYRGWKIDTIPVGDLVNAEFTTEQDIEFDQFSQEVRVASAEDKPLQWLVGGYFYYDSMDMVVPFDMISLAAVFGYPANYNETSFADLETTTLAAFADISYDWSERLTTSVGLRYTHEEKSMSYTHSSNVSDADFQTHINAFFPGFGLTPADFRFAQLFSADVDEDYSDFSPRFVGSYRWSDNLMTYASVSRGFKSGGFNALFAQSPAQLAFDSESAWNYEVGFKSDWLEDRLRLNASVFYFDWKDIQTRSIFQGTGSLVIIIDNAPEAESKGFDIELASKLTANLDATLSYSYIDAEFGTFTNSPNGDITGNSMPFISDHNVNASLTYRRPVSSNLTAMFRLDYIYKSDNFVDIDNDPQFAVGDRSLVDVRAGIEGKNWEISLWAKNLFDKEYHTFAEPSFTFNAARIGEPRTFGVRVSLSM